MAENIAECIVVPPARVSLIETRYRQILSQMLRGETEILEDIGSVTLGRLCSYSNVALISAYVVRPQDPVLEDMEVLHLALSGEYFDRAEDERRDLLPKNVLVFPGGDSEHEAAQSRLIDACPALDLEDLRMLASSAIRESAVLDEVAELRVADGAVTI